MAAAVLSSLAGCGSTSSEEASVSSESEASVAISSVVESEESSVSSISEEETVQLPEGTYQSETSGEAISTSLQNQRPIAVMIDNESIALPHYGTAEADVVYEMMNSTLNGRITRLMCIYKDWEGLTYVGSIRSTRPTNIILSAEWDAVLCHDGGPIYVYDYFAKDYATEHFSGIFSRVDNGKPTEFTEYILAGDLDWAFEQYGYSKEYNEYKNEDDTHFNFTPYGTEVDLTENYSAASAATDVSLPFYHNESELHYNYDTQTYDYYEYGEIHADADTGAVLTFDNVILQDCDYTVYDENGYMIYNVVASGQPGYYLTRGQMIPITWTKESETDITRYYDEDGNEIQINIGKTYIGIVPSDTWAEVSITG